MRKELKNIVPILILLGIGLIARIVFALNLGMIDGDSAVFGLMAKHILEAKEFPIYMPLLHYAGSISSYMGAMLFALFGISVTVYNFVAVLLSFMGVLLSYYMIKNSLDKWCVVAVVAIAAFPCYQFLQQSFLTGIRAESFFFIPLILLCLIGWRRLPDRNFSSSTIWIGLVSGIGLWVTPGAIPAILTVITIMAIDRKNINLLKSLTWFAAGFIVGYSPGIVYSFQYPSATLLRMMGKLLEVDRSILTAADPAGIIVGKISWKISTMPALAWKMPGVIMASIGMPCGILFITSSILILREHLLKKIENIAMWNILCVYIIYCGLYYVVFTGQSDIRYAIPLCLVSPLFIGYIVSRIGRISHALSAVLLAFIVIYNCYTVAHWLLRENEDRYSEVAKFLVSKGLSYGFSHYFPAYILQFETKEKVIISPTIFHSAYCDRYPQDTERIRSASDIFYIIDKYALPKCAALLNQKLIKDGISYKKEIINGFDIYYDLSSKIYPEELSLPNVYESK